MIKTVQSNESTGVVLFGHGARDPRWREPFEKLLSIVAASHGGPVALAFLELMSPNLGDACKALVQRGARRIVVVPVFLGVGGHLRRDLPELVEAAQRDTPVPIEVVPAIGEDADVVNAIAGYCVKVAR
jgi:sirohydrochlorin cobaltochelatase